MPLINLHIGGPSRRCNANVCFIHYSLHYNVFIVTRFSAYLNHMNIPDYDVIFIT